MKAAKVDDMKQTTGINSRKSQAAGAAQPAAQVGSGLTSRSTEQTTGRATVDAFEARPTASVRASSSLPDLPTPSAPARASTLSLDVRAQMNEFTRLISKAKILAAEVQRSLPLMGPADARIATKIIAALDAEGIHPTSVETNKLPGLIIERRACLDAAQPLLSKLSGIFRQEISWKYTHPTMKKEASQEQGVADQNKSRFALLVLREQPELKKKCDLGLRVSDILFNASTGKRQPSRWNGAGITTAVLTAAERKIAPKNAIPDANDYRRRNGLEKISIADTILFTTLLRFVAADVSNLKEFGRITAYLEALGACPPQTAKGSCRYPDPGRHVLPSTLVDQSLSLIDQVRPTLAFCTAEEKTAFKQLCGLVDKASRLDLESRAEGTQWLQVTYLVDHEIELVELSQAVFTCLDTLRVRLLERDEQLEAAGRPAPKLSKSKKAASKAAASAALQILLPAPENSQVASLENLGKATTETSLRVVPPPVIESAAPNDPTFTLVERRSRARLVKLTPNLNIYSALSESSLKNMIERLVDPGTFYRGQQEESWLPAARSLQYHLIKHAGPDVLAETYLEQAISMFDKKEMKIEARVDRYGQRVQVLQDPKFYAVFSWTGKVLTFCDRQRCGRSHYPQPNRAGDQ
jgi:hypothetical protein